ncbi:MAG: hypothetical protein ACI841_001972 [Planctomycetota bacterium]|jgi:hypothetical protein
MRRIESWFSAKRAVSSASRGRWSTSASCSVGFQAGHGYSMQTNASWDGPVRLAGEGHFEVTEGTDGGSIELNLNPEPARD